MLALGGRFNPPDPSHVEAKEATLSETNPSWNIRLDHAKLTR